MKSTRIQIASAALFAAASAGALAVAAQNPPAQTPPNQAPRAGAQAGRGRGAGGGGGGFANAFPQHAPGDPAAIERGKALYGVNCTFCHGSDARGGEGGPNLIRSQLVLNDKDAELITPVVQNGRPDQGMPKIDLTAAQVKDIAQFLHSFRTSGYDASRDRPPSILVGNAKDGEAYFQQKCASCHSVTGDLQGLAGKFAEPRALQQNWLMPGGGRGGRGGAGGGTPVTVTVTLSNGQRMEGRLLRIDDFLVSFADANGAEHTVRRDGAVPKVDLHDPIEPHRELLKVYNDKNIHDVTAYLVTLK